jgi:hypothetical protein
MDREAIAGPAPVVPVPTIERLADAARAWDEVERLAAAASRLKRFWS